jgi:hypothetical protein
MAFAPSTNDSGCKARPRRTFRTGDGGRVACVAVRAANFVRSIAILRVCIGTVVTFATVPFLRASVRDQPHSGALVLFARTVGIRDLVFGGACLSALANGDRREVRRWLIAWLVNELADVAAGAVATRHLGRSGAAIAATVPVPLIAADIWALRHLSEVLEDQPTG